MRLLFIWVAAIPVLVLVSACGGNGSSEASGDGNDLPPEDVADVPENCRSTPVRFANGNLAEFDTTALEFRVWHPAAPEESGPTWTYSSVEGFVEEGGLAGRKTRTHELEYTGGPSYATDYSYEDERLVERLSQETDHGHDEWRHEFVYDSWDNQNRPLRAFVDTYFRPDTNQEFSLVCSSDQWTFEYSEEENTVTTRVVPGNGAECRTEVIIETVDDENFVVKKEVWFDSTNADGTPDQLYETSEVLERELVCSEAGSAE